MEPNSWLLKESIIGLSLKFHGGGRWENILRALSDNGTENFPIDAIKIDNFVLPYFFVIVISFQVYRMNYSF